MSSPPANSPSNNLDEIAAVMDQEEVPLSREEKIARFETLLNDGRKAFLCQDWSTASENLSEAAELSVELYGDFAAETFAPHFYYGSTQLELAAIEKEVVDVQLVEGGEEFKEIKKDLKEVIQTVIQTLPIPEVPPQEQQEAAEGEQKMEEKSDETPKAEGEQNEVSKEEEQKEQPIDAEKPTGEKPAVVESGDHPIDNDPTDEAEEKLEADSEDVSVDEDDAEADRAQCAFELLDYARLVVEKQTEKTTEWLKREWEVRIPLAQCAMNENNYEVVIDEYSKALDIVRTHFPEERREIAFICVEMNRANRAAKKFDEAADNLDAALAALREFKDIKQKEAETATEEAKAQVDKLLSELDEMIMDLEDEKRLNATGKAEVEQKEDVGQNIQQDKENAAVSNEVIISESKNPDAPIEVITYKRKAKDTTAHEDAEKKAKVDAGGETTVA